MKTQCSGKEGLMALKLDMSKTYDRVEWIFLEKNILKMGFQNTWVRMIMECITTVSYSILVNGEPKCLIKPFQGLPQGDSLSLFSFFFVPRVFMLSLPKRPMRGRFKGILYAEMAQKSLTFFFADDCLLFCRANSSKCGKIL